MGGLDEADRQVGELLQRRNRKHLDRLLEREDVRRKFKQERLDGAFSTFTDTAMLGLVLGEVLRGVANSGQLWGALRSHHRRGSARSDPGFGSGGFGRPGKVWGSPTPGGRGGFRTRGGIGGRGGFRTRGGIGGGGGFRKGGGF